MKDIHYIFALKLLETTFTLNYFWKNIEKINNKSDDSMVAVNVN